MNQLHTSQITLQSFGYLLQRIHFPKHMQGYHVYLLNDGTVSSQSVNAIARLTLTRESFMLLSYVNNLSVGPEVIDKDESLELTNSMSVIYNNIHFLFIPHPEKPVTGWPYRAEIQIKATPINISFINKSIIRIGRKSNCDIVLPSHNNNDNIIWREEYQDKDSVPTGTGFTPKSRFSTDTIMVSTEHAGICHENGHFVLQNIGKNCSSFIRRDDSIFALTPQSKSNGSTPQTNIPLQDTDMLYVGNRLFRVQLSLTTSEPHLDPSRFIHEAFPTHPGEVEATEPKRQSISESLAEQARRFFSPASPSPSPTPSDPPSALAIKPQVSHPIEDQETTYSLEPTLQKSRPAHRNNKRPLRSPSAIDSNTISMLGPENTNAPPAAQDIPEYAWELSLSARYQVRILGWLVKGTQRVGNSLDHDIIIPENRIQPTQEFKPQDYCTLHFRRGTDDFHAHNSRDIIIPSKQPKHASKTDFSIIRRGMHGVEDFRISLSPNGPKLIPSSLSLWLDRTDETVAAMFTQSLESTNTQSPFRFSSSAVSFTLQADILCVDLADDLRQVRISQDGQLSIHGPKNPLRLQAGEKAIIDNCIIEWHIKK